jgi:hypothetical protein
MNVNSFVFVLCTDCQIRKTQTRYRKKHKNVDTLHSSEYSVVIVWEYRSPGPLRWRHWGSVFWLAGVSNPTTNASHHFICLCKVSRGT